MIISLALVLFATASGTIITYLYDESAAFSSRLCTGACIGLATLGLIGFVFASFLGLTPLAISLTVIVLSLPILLLKNPVRRRELREDLAITSQSIRRTLLRPSRGDVGYVLFYVAAAVILWRVFDRAMIETPEGIATGVINNFGDLPFHISVITSFAYGNNFPPEDPTFAGVKFTYPFLVDFISAVFVRCGATLRQSVFLENFILAISLVGLLHRWAWEMLRDRLAAVITPVLVILNGGFGWILLWQQAKQNEQGLWGILKELPSSFTIISNTTWRWGNSISTLLVPQRGMLLGLTLAVIVFTQWWLSADDTATRGRGDTEKVGRGKLEESPKNATRNKDKDRRVAVSPSPRVLSSHRMIAAGVVAALLPLVHAHSFAVVMAVGACLALIERRWRDWLAFFLVSSLLALPQIWWSTHNSAVHAASFVEWQFGWDHGKDNVVWFWFKNTGLFIPLIVAAILWRGKEYLIPRRLLLFYLPFTLCFIIPNVTRLAPWGWDNIKVLFYWWVASAPLVALLLVRLWRHGKLLRTLAVLLFICVTLAGGLDVASIVTRSTKYEVFNARGVEFAEMIKRQTEPQALILHAPVHDHPVFLTGRRTFMGYPGHIWTHGLDFVPREAEIKRIYSGTGDADALIRKHRIAYAVVGPQERNVARVNDQFFSRFAKVGEVGEYSLYKLAQP